jgi:Domain of unknown function (DUF4145)
LHRRTPRGRNGLYGLSRRPRCKRGAAGHHHSTTWRRRCEAAALGVASAAMADLQETIEDAKKARAGEMIPAAFRKGAFNCVFCAAFAKQNWRTLVVKDAGGYFPASPIWVATCTRCDLRSYWMETKGQEGQMLWPFGGGTAPHPHPAMPDDVREDYEEARSIVERSTRGAAALLRLALQKLMPHLGQPGKDLNKDIGALVAAGLDVRVQKSLDTLRVIGNNSVHPGEMDIRDDAETAQGLFKILNFIVEQLIEMPQRLQDVYESLPGSARAAIEKRDAPGAS